MLRRHEERVSIGQSQCEKSRVLFPRHSAIRETRFWRGPDIRHSPASLHVLRCPDAVVAADEIKGGSSIVRRIFKHSHALNWHLTHVLPLPPQVYYMCKTQQYHPSYDTNIQYPTTFTVSSMIGPSLLARLRKSSVSSEYLTRSYNINPSSLSCSSFARTTYPPLLPTLTGLRGTNNCNTLSLA